MSASPADTFQVSWTAVDDLARIPPGRVLLSWKAAARGSMDVTAHLGLPGAEVLLATWPGLTGNWSHIVRPTVVEVMGLHSALTSATVIAELLAT